MTGTRNPLVVLATGGTGGHVFPAEALAGELSARGFRLALVTDRRGDVFSGVLGDLETHRIRAGGVAGKKLVALIQSGSDLAIGLFQARSLLKRLKPQAVIGFGGYASVPTMLAACFGGYATAIHEQNAVLGRANRLLATRVRRIATCFERVEGLPDETSNKVVFTGMPVRPAVAACRDHPYPSLDDDGLCHLLVVGGSQGARVLSDVVPAALGRLPAKLQNRLRITQQCRPEDLDRVRASYSNLKLDATLNSFFADLPERIATAHLVIGRSGASTVAELSAIGRPAILVPYPHAVDDHQAGNAHAIDDAGGGWLMSEDTFTPEALAKRLDSLFGLPVVLKRTAANACAAGRPKAVDELADMVAEVISNGANGGGDQAGRRAA
ncbi:MAG: undecaprenyldiphospho-muramoylpentapeptide beta-N-acetylglucosaminyltransferase [Rhodospirillaceae bacterium]|nr:undecaprenyldiphospho-muramoylpentapeptide beta-N-acetylglucosaminyltransferase [Rhodospirillaceae bacterium]